MEGENGAKGQINMAKKMKSTLQTFELNYLYILIISECEKLVDETPG